MWLVGSSDWSANERGLEEAFNLSLSGGTGGLAYEGLGEACHSSALEASRGYFMAALSLPFPVL